MPVELKEPRWIYPPRPGGAINPITLDRYPGFLGQPKYNDVRTVVYLLPRGEVRLYNRNSQPQGAYPGSDQMVACLRALRLDPIKLHVLDGGILHGRGSELKHRIVLWDILVWNNQYLVGTSYLRRYQLLSQICGNPTQYESETGRNIALRVNSCVWLAPIYRSELKRHFDELIPLHEIEGLVLKNPAGKLQWGLREDNNGDWQIRVRKPRHDYAF